MVQNTVNDAAHSGYDDFATNEDGSLDLFFGPEAPAGPATNWIQTAPGRGFYVMFRCYTKTSALFDGTWTATGRRADLTLVCDPAFGQAESSTVRTWAYGRNGHGQPARVRPLACAVSPVEQPLAHADDG